MLHPIKPSFQKLSMSMSALALLASVSLLPMVAQAECAPDHWQHAKHSENFEKDMSTLHDALALSQSQQLAWHDFTVALKPKAHEAQYDRAKLSQLPTPDRLDQMLSMMKLRQEKMASNVQSIKSFYSTLTPQQKTIFDQKFNEHFQHQHQR
jgi:protein CpxP